MPLIIATTNNKGQQLVLVIMGPDNLERIKEKDPMEVELYKMPLQKPVAVVGITYASDAELTQIEQLMRQGKDKEAIDLATVGWKYRPEMGNHDLGPQRM